MSSPESGKRSRLQSISSDSDLQEHLRTRAQESYSSRDQDPACLYTSIRNFQVEPLATDTAVFLIEQYEKAGTAKEVNSRTIVCWCPLAPAPLAELGSRFESWGYSVDSITKADTSGERVPVVEITARHSPSIREQLRVLSVVGAEPEVLLDGWVTVVQNHHREPDDRMTIEEWAGMRGVKPEVVRENTSRLAELLREFGGIPGTQWEMSEHGGVPVPGISSERRCRHSKG
jgi:hypothetical protein